MDHGFQGREGEIMPVMPDVFVEKVSERYIELYELITGKSFTRIESTQIIDRIDNNVREWLSAHKQG